MHEALIQVHMHLSLVLYCVCSQPLMASWVSSPTGSSVLTLGLI